MSFKFKRIKQKEFYQKNEKEKPLVEAYMSTFWSHIKSRTNYITYNNSMLLCYYTYTFFV